MKAAELCSSRGADESRIMVEVLQCEWGGEFYLLWWQQLSVVLHMEREQKMLVLINSF